MNPQTSNRNNVLHQSERWVIKSARFWLALAFTGGLSSVASAGATPNHDGDAQLLGVWPPPPALARVRYVQSIASPPDLGIHPSAWTRFGNAISGGNKGKETLVTPCGIALDEADNLCLTDSGAATVWFFDRKRKKFQRWAEIGKTRLVSPVAVAKRNHTIFVADSGLAKVLAFDINGKRLFEITNALERPAGLALSGDRLFVADSSAHRIAMFDLRGKFLSQFGKRGSGPGELNFPTHLAADHRSQIFVTDSMNGRIQVFTTEGVFQKSISEKGDGSGHLNRPKGVAVDRHGHVFVVDALFDNFQVFDSQGEFLLDVGSAGSNPGEFWLPAGISISRSNQVFVVDSYNQRVQIFQLLDEP